MSNIPNQVLNEAKPEINLVIYYMNFINNLSIKDLGDSPQSLFANIDPQVWIRDHV